MNVLDTPSPPRMLQPDEVRAEHVKLSWMPPLDDGGTPITNYLVRYMDIDTGEWVSACTVRGTEESQCAIHRLIVVFFLVPDARHFRRSQGPEARPSLPVRGLRH